MVLLVQKFVRRLAQVRRLEDAEAAQHFLGAEEREGLPTVTLRPEEIAGAVMMLVEDETRAGRVMIWREGESWRLVPPASTY